MRIEDMEKILERVKNKKDGIYSYDGRFYYVVRAAQLTFLGNKISGEVYQFYCGLVYLGKVETYDLKKHLNKLRKADA